MNCEKRQLPSFPAPLKLQPYGTIEIQLLVFLFTKTGQKVLLVNCSRSTFVHYWFCLSNFI